MEKKTVHAAASSGHCKKMAKKYGWQLVGIKKNGNGILPVDCFFDGDAQFPESIEGGEADG